MAQKTEIQPGRPGTSNVAVALALSVGATLLSASFLATAAPALAEPARFDLAGPRLAVTVTHAGATLPITQTPNLSPGDQLSIRADLPAGQSVHYLLIAAFLRGATNPPPKSWFHRADTWTRQGQGGLKLTVPADAQQLVVFLAPQTGGDFATLVDAVRGRPGAFVRASQDLDQASLDRSRLDVFLADVRAAEGDPDRLKAISPLLARSLDIKFDPSCLDKAPELQAPCLTSGEDALVLNDGHSVSIVEALTSGPSADLAVQLSATPQAGFGAYSPYVGAAMDIARIFDSFRTAQYQYIPALAVAQGDELALVLNTPPSFHDPKSVLVAALPAIEPPQPPPLRPVDPKTAYCAERPGLALAAEGAPLVFSTAYAHDLVLHLKGETGASFDAPLKADPQAGGLVADTSGLDAAKFGGTLEASVHGVWGFEPFVGPTYRLQTATSNGWRLADQDAGALIVGRTDTVRLEGGDPACVQAVDLQAGSGPPTALDWKAQPPAALSVETPLEGAEPGPAKILIRSYGQAAPQALPVETFAQAGRLDAFDLHAGDAAGVLKGVRLDEVKTLSLHGIAFEPGLLSSADGVDALALTTSDALGVQALKVGETSTAKVELKDGRTLRLKTTVQPARPDVILIDRSVAAPSAPAPLPIRLGGGDQLPQGGVLTFSIRAAPPTRLANGDRIEVADADGAVVATLTTADGLMVEDPKVAIATLDTGKLGEMSGPLRFRLVDADGAGDWRPLTTVVRLPRLTGLTCAGGHEGGCMLSGARLFLIDAVSADPTFDHAVRAPEGFTGAELPVPHPVGSLLYIRLHDDPASVDAVALPARETAATARRPAP